MNKKSLNAKIVSPKTKILIHLKDRKIKKIYNNLKLSLKPFLKKNKFAVGVSGGIDSLSLAFFLKCLSLESKIKVFYFHVDHGLRKNSNKEAKQLFNILNKVGIKIEILKWEGSKPSSNIQKIARDNRYGLFFNKMSKYNIKYLLVAHHKNDSLENFLIRLIRGSGLEGLTSFNSQHIIYKDKNILRPLLQFNKKDLEYVSKRVFKLFIDDKSNYENKFQRSRIRVILRELEKEGLNISKMNLTIKNLSLSNSSINYIVRNNLEINCHINYKKNTAIFNENFLKQPDEIVFRSISIILNKISNRYYPSRGKKIIRLIRQIKQPNFKKTTLAKCLIEKNSNTYKIMEENVKKN